jgi:hypothetical protein
MNRRIFLCIATLLLAISPAPAQSENASELATQNVKRVDKVVTSAQWVNLLHADFKKPGKKDLFILVTLDCGVYSGTPGNAFDDATLAVRVFVDGHLTRPGVVSFCGKANGLVPPFSQLATCSSNSLSSCGFTADELSEINRSLRAHAFNFLLINIPKGIQNITVQGKVQEGSSTGPAFAVVGAGSLEALVVNLKEEGPE